MARLLDEHWGRLTHLIRLGLLFGSVLGSGFRSLVVALVVALGLCQACGGVGKD